MPTSPDFRNFILNQLSSLDKISSKQMMGEFIIYFRGKIAAYLCDNRLLVKPVPSALAFVKNPEFASPYPGAKEMLLIEDIDSATYLTDLFLAILNELPFPKKTSKK